MTFIQELIIGVLGSFIASIVFIFSMYRLRPKLQLSNKIAKTVYRGQTLYALKVVNVGKRDAILLKAELLIIEPNIIEGGIGYNILDITLVRNELFLLRPLSKVGNKFGAVFEFITTETLEAWERYKNSYLIFRVNAHDALSGFSKVFTVEYHSPKETIVEGRFGKGASMKIGPHEITPAEDE